MARFVTSNRKRKDVDALINLKKQPEESLRQYADRYWELFNEIHGCDQSVAASSFKLGLDSQSRIFSDLTLHPPQDMDDLMLRVEKFCQLEELISERSDQRLFGSLHHVQPPASEGSEGS